MRVSFSFSGWISGVKVRPNSLMNAETGEELSPEEFNALTEEEIIDKLGNSELLVDFVASLRDCKDYKVEIFDFEKTT